MLLNYLGMTLDNILDMKKQIGVSKRNVDHKLYMFRRIRKNLPTSASLNVVKTMILPVLDYGDIIYDVAPKTIKDNLQPLISNALRTVYWNENTKNHQKLHKLADLNLLDDRREMHMLVHSFRASLKIDRIDHRPIRTRAHDERLIKSHRVKNGAYRKSLLHRTSTVWNRLDVAIRCHKNETEFKSWLKKEYDKKVKALPNV